MGVRGPGRGHREAVVDRWRAADLLVAKDSPQGFQGFQATLGIPGIPQLAGESFLLNSLGRGARRSVGGGAGGHAPACRWHAMSYRRLGASVGVP